MFRVRPLQRHFSLGKSLMDESQVYSVGAPNVEHHRVSTGFDNPNSRFVVLTEYKFDLSLKECFPEGDGWQTFDADAKICRN